MNTMRAMLLVLVVMAGAAAPLDAMAQRKQPAEVVVASPVELAVYVPPSMLKARFYASRLWVEPGKALSDAVQEAGKLHFPNMVLLPSQEDVPYALLADLDPEWDITRGNKLQLAVKYDVYSVDGEKLLDSKTEQSVPIRGGNLNAAAEAAAALAIGHVMADIQRRLKPESGAFPASGATAAIDLAKLVDRAKPLRTGTAFFVNTDGHLLTAAHVARECVLLEAHHDGDTFPVTVKASSGLLDVAVLDSGRPRSSALALREGNGIMLGEAVTSVGFPLKGLLGDSPNVTRGNVSSSRGIRGSMGMFQFSAPIQPGNSGGPVVSDNGELLGMAVSTLNAGRMAERGLIPQNVNFALDGRYVAKFLRRQGVAFDEIRPEEGAGGLQVANQAALANTVQLNCYE